MPAAMPVVATSARARHRGDEDHRPDGQRPSDRPVARDLDEVVEIQQQRPDRDRDRRQHPVGVPGGDDDHRQDERRDELDHGGERDGPLDPLALRALRPGRGAGRDPDGVGEHARSRRRRTPRSGRLQRGRRWTRLPRTSQKAANAAWISPPTRLTRLDHAAVGLRSAALVAVRLGPRPARCLPASWSLAACSARRRSPRLAPFADPRAAWRSATAEPRGCRARSLTQSRQTISRNHAYDLAAMAESGASSPTMPEPSSASLTTPACACATSPRRSASPSAAPSASSPT